MPEPTFSAQPSPNSSNVPRLLETEQVESFLLTRLGSGVNEVSPIGHGDWSQAFSFRHGDAALVARFGMHGDDFVKDQIAFRYAAPDLPVPRVREIGQAFDRSFCISERAYGEMLDSLDQGAMQATVPAVLRMLDALRDADLGLATGFGPWNADGNGMNRSWHEYLLGVDAESERVHGWHASMATSPTGTAPYDEALEYLTSQVERCPDLRHLLHTDLLHFNVLVGDAKINAVVDWGNALYGDFLYELAAFTFYAPWYRGMANIDWRYEAAKHYAAAGYEVPDFEARLRCYEAHIGLGGMGYSAFVGRWDDLADHAARTVTLIRGEA